MKHIYIFGSINTDLVISAPYMPKKGETLMGSDFFTAHGGKGANQAVAAARSGGNVSFCGAVGNDLFGKSALESLKIEGINCKHIKVVPGIASGTAVIVVTDGDNRIILDAGANATTNKEDVDEFLSKAQEGDVFLAQLESPIEVVGYALKAAKEKGMTVVLNPAPANKEINPYLKYVDIFTPNESECDLFGGIESLKGTVKTLIVTLGSEGYRVIEGTNDQKYPCMKIKDVDTTAAGDTFCGAMVAMLSNGLSLEDACAYGSKAASIACTRKGAQPSVPTKEEVLNWRK